MKLISLHNAGSMNIDEVVINVESIVSIQKPKADTFGCIISTENGEKFPVSEEFDAVIKSIKTIIGG